KLCNFHIPTEIPTTYNPPIANPPRLSTNNQRRLGFSDLEHFLVEKDLVIEILILTLADTTNASIYHFRNAFVAINLSRITRFL
ncbi:MAG: hypothetical protein AAF063_36790, partial [Cyanobacteria bacterium J06643_5]